MLRSFIVSVFENSIEVVLWIVLILCALGGWAANGVLGLFVFLVAGLIFEIVFFGALLVVFDIRSNLAKIKEEIQNYKENR